MKFNCDEVSLEVEIMGTDEPVLIIHGFTGCGAAMEPLTERLVGRRIVPDLIGHGRSEAPVSLDLYSLESISSQLLSLLQQLDASPVSIVGYSLGGRVALTFALTHPEMVKSLALIGASPGISNQEERERRLKHDCQLGDSISRVGIRSFINSWVAMPMWESLRESLTPQQWQDSIKQRVANHPLGLANSLRASGSGAMPPLHNNLEHLATPTLLLVGEKDSKFLNIAKEMAPKIAQANIKVIKNSGHAAHLEQPAATAEAIMEHFSCS
ncbi:MAG TPA: 2-succinyl-6-hydroxy-2,4-cyclohexadiene-1-carboxylate synthase [Acidimicrobiaceae bacterium]|nr:2-succinyl-6-hydroxy-2,4-cyclohexadiene-1-carboxylate synthase [Acidimicrobiaceae bacterium]